MVLPRLTVLDERYAIGRVVEGPAPFVHVYQAWDLHTEDQVDLYEYFPAALATRAGGDPGVQAVDEALFRYGCAQFLKEASVLASLDHPNLVRMLACFEAHGTAYRVMAHHVGATLASVLEKRAGGLPPKTAFTVLMPVLEGLQAAHRQGLLHGAVSPETVFLSRAGGPMLRDFRTAHLMLAQRSGDWSSLVRDGYSAPEQYACDGRQGPWTDVYGCAALFFEMLTGKRPPASPRRLEQDDVPALLRRAAGFPEALRDLFEQALSLDAARRPRSVQALQKALLEVARPRAGKAAVKPLAAPSSAGSPAAEPEVRSGGGPVAGVEAPAPVEAVKAAQAPMEEETPSISFAVEEAGAPAVREKDEPKPRKPDRTARPSKRKEIPVLAALAVAVLVALSGAYVVLHDDGGEWSLFAHFKAQGDSLFARANYTAATTEYERALAAQPGDSYVAGRLHETRRRLAEVSEDRYVLYLALGDSLYAAARSSFNEGKARRSLDYFAEANRAYYEALKYRPDDQVVLEKGRLTAEGMKQARRVVQMTPGENGEAATASRRAQDARPGAGDAHAPTAHAEGSTTVPARSDHDAPAAESGVYKVVDESPQLIGGLEALNGQVRYPEAALREGVWGRVYVQFVVDEQGHVRDPRVVRGIGGGCDEEALRVIREARFEAGKMDGRPVKVLHTLFITFTKP